MQRNNQSFIKALVKFLNNKAESKPTYEGVTLLGKGNKSDSGSFKINFNNTDYILRLYVSQPWREDGKPFINLIDENRPKGKNSIIQYTIDDINFIIDRDTFVLKQNKVITIGTKQEGLKEESEKLMLDLGFNQDKTILQGKFSSPDFESITKNLFKWLRIRATAKLQLEEKFRSLEVEKKDGIINDNKMTETIWKLGCNWDKGNPSFYGLIKDNEIVIGVEDKKYSVGDLILITEGFNAMSIAKILESPQLVTATKKFEEPFEKLKIPFEDWVNISNVEWHELEENERFTYQLQAGIRKVQNSTVKQKVIDLWNSRNSTESKTDADMKTKNIILYGPPGTGKTYHSIDKAVEIASGKSALSHTENKRIFDELRRQGQVEFLTFHQNYSYEDFMIGLKPDIENEILRFRQHKGIFYEIAKRARENYFASKEKTSLSRNFNEVLNEILSPLVNQGLDVDIKMASGISYKINDVSDYSIHFKKAKGDSKHSLSIQTLEDIIEGRRSSPRGIDAYYNPLIEKIKEMMKLTGGAKIEEQKNFVLVIDEINRANISKVFGELITLLEDDKRLGEENELKITLPNGEKEFGIPPNLYIIGTMNTADKSIALIDIALRRRFEFVGYYPQYERLDDEESSTLLKKINEAVFKEKKSADYLIGHAYFMKGQPIRVVLKNKVIPLLMEYFSGKTEIVSKIFADTTWNITYDSTNFIWDISPR